MWSAWASTRAASAALIVLGSYVSDPPLWLGVANLSMHDGRWYEGIALREYPNDNVALQQSGYPFFPAFTWLLKAVAALGLSYDLAGPAVAMGAFGLGLWGTYRLASRHASVRVACLSVWALVLFPMSAVHSMAYPSSLVLAATVWSLDFADRGRDGTAGVLAAVACLSRPNGLAVAAALGVTAGSWRRAWPLAGPSVAALAGWMLALWWWTGNPFVFITDKAAWNETSLLEAVTLRSAYASAYVHLVVASVGLLPVALAWRLLPRAWLVLVVAYVLPSLVFGVVGVGRTVAECAPVFIAVAMLLDATSTRTRTMYFTVAGGAAIAVTIAFAVHAVLP